MSSPIKQLKLKTFASQLPKMSKSKTGNSAVCNTELLGRLLLISDVREVNLEKLFTYLQKLQILTNPLLKPTKPILCETLRM